MTVAPAADDNLIHGLSDFWVAFFRDSERLRDVYAAQAVQYGQVYLDLLDAVLGLSLEHVPLFSRRYFKDFYVREDRLIFSEGAAPSLDRWVHVTEERLAGVTWLMNRVIEPTAVAEPGTDYELREGSIAFFDDPFTSPTFSSFPVRTMDTSFPAAATGSWDGVRAGDVARYVPAGGRAAYVRVAAVRGTLAYFDRKLPEFDSASGGVLTVLRVPFDYRKSSSTVSPQPVASTPVTVRAVGGTRDLEVTGAHPSWVGTYIAFTDEAHARNGGFHRVNATGSGVVTVDSPGLFVDSTPQPGHRVNLGADYGAAPAARLENANLRPGSVSVQGRAADGAGLVEGVDYVVDHEAGTLRFLSAWDPATVAMASYEWDLAVATAAYGDADGFVGTRTVSVKEMALWGADVSVDRETLYTNFGYLLGFRRDSSEAYRAFLKGVAQLYLLGPNASRFESALNVMAGYPVAREDGERLVRRDNGVWSSGVGSVSDHVENRDGVLASGTSRFTSATANFTPGDMGAVIAARVAGSVVRYTVTSIVSATTAVVTPTPPDAIGVEWTYRHVGTSGRFVATTRPFSADDVGAFLSVSGARNARNNGVFRVSSVEGPSVLVLESTYGFADEAGLAWSLTRTNESLVVTDRRTYRFPFGTPMRTGVTTFNAYDPFTDVFEVVCEQIDPTWWHRVYIPPEVLEDVEPARRYVSPMLVEHLYGAVDTPCYGDPDFYFGLDDEGQPPAARSGAGVWLGGQWVTAPEPLVSRDVGRYALVRTENFNGDFLIEAVLDDNVTMKLERFPPPEAVGLTPPVSLFVTLPAILYRRSIPFIMMDRFLKRHAVAVRVHPDAPVTAAFMVDASRLVREARPSHAHVYLESTSRLRDAVSLSEEVGLAVTAHLVDAIPVVDTRWFWLPDAIVQYGDAYTYVEETTTISYPGGAYTTTVVATAPYVGPYRTGFLSARFTDGTVTVSGHTRSLAEGADYTFDKLTGVLTFLRGNAGTLHLVTVAYFLRARLPADTLLDYETRIHYGGNDPSNSAPGLSDRAISIRLS